MDARTRGAVRCAVCGNSWTVCAGRNRAAFMTFIAAIMAMVSAIIFATAVILRDRGNASASSRPLVATVTNIDTTVDASGVPHFVVSGRVVNQSGDIYGVPDLIIISRDDAGRELARQKFMPSATLLDAGAYTEFTHTLTAPSYGVKKITVELKDQTETQ